MDYGHLREQYPAVISKDQLYRICHISKRKALWLLEHGVIPCEDSGKQTRRFRIQLEDVIDFLERRDASPAADLPDGKLLFEHEYADDEGLLSWMLSLRDKVTVIEPESIREELFRIATELTKKYKEA